MSDYAKGLKDGQAIAYNVLIDYIRIMGGTDCFCEEASDDQYTCPWHVLERHIEFMQHALRKSSKEYEE